MKMSLKSVLLAGTVAAIAMSGSAYAGAISFYGSRSTILTGTTPISALPGTNNGVTITVASPGAIVQGSKTNEYAAPITDAAGTPYAGNYFSTELTSNPSITTATTTGDLYVSPASSGIIDFSFATSQSYLGLLWGSVDGTTNQENVLSFYNGTTLVGSITGAQVAADANVSANGVQSYGGSAYININVSGGFNQVVAGSQKVSFEFAALTSSTKQILVPEPGSLALLGTSLIALGLFARKRQKRT